MLKSIVSNIAMSIGGILVTLILFETGVRFLPLPYPETESSALICSPDLGWRGAPNHKTTFETEGYEHTVKLNKAGMHDTDHSQSKPANTFRILMLGDSFVQASQVNEAETSHQVLEDLLNDGHQPEKFEVIGAGVHRWGTAQQLVYYRTEGRHYQPDLVLLMVYLGNDVQDNLPGKIQTADGVNCYAPYFALCDSQLDIDPWTYAPGVIPVTGQCPFGKKLMTTSLGTLYQVSRLYAQIEPYFVQKHEIIHRDWPYRYLYIPLEHQQFSRLPIEKQSIEYGWQITFELFAQLQREVTADGTEFAMVLIPPGDVIKMELMNTAEQEEVYRKFPYLRDGQSDLPNRKIIGQLSGQNIDILDLQPLIKEQQIKEAEIPLYLPVDKHWTVAGNYFVAETIYTWLNEVVWQDKFVQQ